eukprot:4672534-Pleurochrysis_carterae.AAC.1
MPSLDDAHMTAAAAAQFLAAAAGSPDAADAVAEAMRDAAGHRAGGDTCGEGSALEAAGGACLDA